MLFKSLATLFVLFLSSTVFASSPHVSATVSPNALSIGDIVTYTINITMEATDNLIKVPKESEFSANPSLSFLDSRVTKTMNDTMRQVSLDYDFQVFDINQQRIPTQQITIKNEVYKTITIPAVSLTIIPTKPPENKDIQLSDYIFINTSLNWVPIVILIIVIVLIGWGGYKLFLKYRSSRLSSTTISEVIDPRSPYEIATESLSENYNQISNILLKDYYVRYSDIIKTYLNYLLQLDNAEMTSSEILRLCHDRFNEQDYRRIKKCLNFSDSVKFAKAPASADDNQQYYQKALEMIDGLEAQFKKADHAAKIISENSQEISKK